MPQRLSKRFMNDIFADMIDVIVIIYLDDILIYSTTLPNTRLTSEKYFADSTLTDFLPIADKCEFHVTSCEYLRYMLSPEGLTMAPYKVQIIQKLARTPKGQRHPVFPRIRQLLSSTSFSDTLKSPFRSCI